MAKIEATSYEIEATLDEIEATCWIKLRPQHSKSDFIKMDVITKKTRKSEMDPRLLKICKRK